MCVWFFPIAIFHYLGAYPYICMRVCVFCVSPSLSVDNLADVSEWPATSAQEWLGIPAKMDG